MRSPHIFSLFFLNNPLILGDDAARNFPEKTARPKGALRIFFGKFLAASSPNIFLREEKEEK